MIGKTFSVKKYQFCVGPKDIESYNTALAQQGQQRTWRRKYWRKGNWDGEVGRVEKECLVKFVMFMLVRIGVVSQLLLGS